MPEFQEDLYREVILDHFKNPRNKGVLESPDIQANGANPLCGDEIEIMVKVKEGKIEAFRINTKGCAISQASASMMAQSLEGKSLGEVKALISFFRDKMLSGKSDPWPQGMEDLEALEGVKKYPVRVKCAVLPWNTLAGALKEFEAKGAGGKVSSRHTEE